MSRVKIGSGRVLLASPAIPYIFRDEFVTNRAAGTISGTTSEPGPGVRNTTAGNVAISAGEIAATGTGTWGAAGWYASPGISRAAGKLLIMSCKASATSIDAMTGFTSGIDYNLTGYNHNGFYMSSGPSLRVRGTSGSNSPIIYSPAVDTYDRYLIALRSTGFFPFCVIGGQPLLLYAYGSGSDAMLYSGATVNVNAVTMKHDYMRVVAALWLPTPLVSDGFGSSFGTSDGLGHAEGVAGGIGSGGDGLTWTQQSGTWGTSSSKAQTTVGGASVATVPTSTANVLAECKITRSAGQGGLVLRWTDSSNYLYAEHDGTNCYLKQVLAGSTTTLITAAATYSAGAVLRVDVNGTAGRLYYNNALVGTTASINSGLTSTTHGIRSTSTSVQLDDLVIYAKGTEGQYNLLNQY